MRVALYARVSTDDKGQDPENQLAQLRTWADRAGHTIVGEYVERESGTKGTGARRALNQLFEAASRRDFDLVAFWSLDRFSREGVRQTVLHLERLAAHGVGFHSYTQEFLSTDNELVRDVLVSILAAFAKVERDDISRRTKAGLDRARRSGKRLGRPPLPRGTREAVARLLEDGRSITAISTELGISYGSAWNLVNQVKRPADALAAVAEGSAEI